MTEHTRRKLLRHIGAGTISAAAFSQPLSAVTDSNQNLDNSRGGRFVVQNMTDETSQVAITFSPVFEESNGDPVARLKRNVKAGDQVEIPELGVPTDRYRIKAVASSHTATAEWGIHEAGIPGGKEITVRVLPDRVAIYCADL